MLKWSFLCTLPQFSLSLFTTPPLQGGMLITTGTYIEPIKFGFVLFFNQKKLYNTLQKEEKSTVHCFYTEL